MTSRAFLVPPSRALVVPVFGVALAASAQWPTVSLSFNETPRWIYRYFMCNGQIRGNWNGTESSPSNALRAKKKGAKNALIPCSVNFLIDHCVGTCSWRFRHGPVSFVRVADVRINNAKKSDGRNFWPDRSIWRRKSGLWCGCVDFFFFKERGLFRAFSRCDGVEDIFRRDK